MAAFIAAIFALVVIVCDGLENSRYFTGNIFSKGNQRGVKLNARSKFHMKFDDDSSLKLKPTTTLHRGQEYKQALLKGIVSLGPCSFISLGAFFKPKVVRSIDFVMPECSDSISVLKSAMGKEIVIIGTAHISEDSAQQVRRVIRSVKPSTVMIELDASRVGKVSKSNTLADVGFDQPIIYEMKKSPPQGGESIDTPDRRPNPVSAFQTLVSGWVSRSLGSVVGNTLKQFYKSVEKLGVKAGGEFMAAVEEARAIGARILLGDRDVNVTLERLAVAISNTDIDRFSSLSDKLVELEKANGFSLDPNMSKDSLIELVENLKQRGIVVEVMKLVKAEIPMVYDALIGERDAFMATSISERIDKGSDDRMVAVVGLAHLDGIERQLGSRGYQVISRSCPAGNTGLDGIR